MTQRPRPDQLDPPPGLEPDPRPHLVVDCWCRASHLATAHGPVWRVAPPWRNTATLTPDQRDEVECARDLAHMLEGMDVAALASPRLCYELARALGHLANVLDVLDVVTADL
jgi:hypothetical protein